MTNEIDRATIINKLIRFSSGYSKVKDINSLALMVEEILEEILNVEYSGLYLYDSKKNKLKLIVAKGFTEEEKIEAEKTAIDRHPGYVFKHKKILNIPDAEKDSEEISISSNRSFIVRSRLYIPVLNGEEAVGAFGIVSSEKNKFKEDDIALLSFVGNIAGAIYGNIVLMDKVLLANEKIRTLSNLPKENPNPVFRINFEGIITYANPASKSLLSGHQCAINQPVKGKISVFLEELIKTQKSITRELEDNSGNVFQVNFHLVKEAKYINAYASDITQRKKIEEQLIKASLIAEETDNAAVITNIKGEIEWVNQGFTNMTGYHKDEVLGKIPGDLLQGAQSDPETIKEIAIALSKNKKIERDILNYTKKGKPYWNRIQIQPVFNKEGNRVNFISFQRDITNQVQFEETLKASEAKVRMIIDSALDAVILMDKKGEITDWNPQAEQIFGWTREEVLHKRLSEIIIPNEYKNAHQAGLKNYIKTGVGPVLNQRIEITALRRDGTIFPVELTVSPIKHKDEVSFSGFVRDISKEKKAQQELESISSRLTVLIQELHSGILVEDENGKIALLNDQFHKMFNIQIPPDQIFGTDCSLAAESTKDLFTSPDKFIHRIRILSTNRELVIGDELAMKDGRFLERDYIPIFSNDKFLGNLWQYRDVTISKMFVNDINKARSEAEAANSAKSRFLANMSHEIRTPMNAIYGLTRLIEGTHLSKDQKNMINKLKLSSNNLLKIINDILDFSKIESGQIVLEKIAFSIEDLVTRIVESMEYQAIDKMINLEYFFDEKIDAAHMGDPVRLHQVLLNLVNNAIKFTEQGSVSISCKLVLKTDKMNKILFEVRDTGIGINEENLSKIFKTFEQEDESTTRKYGGTGLGLAISNQLIDLMGSKIEVRSEKNKGSIFYFSLDLEVSKQEIIVKKSSLPIINNNALSGKTILIVEDNKYNQYIAETMLKMWGADVDCTDNGQLALDVLKTNTYDLILMDKQMPVLDGIETTRIIRKKLALNIPIIALTANVVKGVVEKCLNAGMDDYLAKPFELETLYEKILNLLHIPVEYEEIDQNKLLPEISSVNDETLFDLVKLEKILGGNKQQLKRMILKFLEITPEYAEILTAHFNENDIEGVERASHKIKASIDLIANNNLKSNIRLIHDFSKNRTNLDKLPKLIDYFSATFPQLIQQLQKEYEKM